MKVVLLRCNHDIIISVEELLVCAAKTTFAFLEVAQTKKKEGKSTKIRERC